ncbi:MAG: hypothetical protein ACKO28_11850 [Cyanobium sp.]
MALYATTLEKLAQAVELMEETVAADRRRKERLLTAEGPESPEAGSKEPPSQIQGGDQH